MTENHNQSQNTSLERTNIYVPDIGNPDAVTVSSILVSVGDVINIDDNIVSLETDKASMDIPATSSGEVVEVFIKEGAKVKTGDLILSIITNTTNTVTSNAINTQVSPASDKHLNTNNLNSNNFDSSINNIPLSADQVHNKNTSHNTDLSYSTNKNHDSILRDLQQKVFASPSIRLYARQNGIELNKVQGTGKNNRITLLDIQNYQNKTNNNTDSYAPNNTLKLNQNQLINQADNTNSHNKYGEIYTQELGRIKKISAKHLTNCWQTIPHVTQFDEADITELEEFRIQLNKEYQAKKQNTKLTLLAFLIKAVVYVLKEYPDFNASLDETAQNLIYKKYYNIGFAVDTAQGLLVPVIKNADQKSVNEIANEITEKASKIFPIQNVMIRKVKTIKRPRFDITQLLSMHTENTTVLAAPAQEVKA